MTSTIVLHQFPAMLGLPNASPFCMKLETFLRLADLDYTVAEENDPRVSPTKRLPFIEVDGRVIPDSEACIRYLSDQRGVDLDAGLTAEQRAARVAVCSLLEDRLLFALVYSRWIDPRGWPTVRDTFFSGIPLPLRLFVPGLLQRRVRRLFGMSGQLLLGEQALYERGAECLQAMSDLLGDRPYLFGANPTRGDATAYAFLANVIVAPIDSPLKQAGLGHPNLVAYCDRMAKRAFGEAANAA